VLLRPSSQTHQSTQVPGIVLSRDRSFIRFLRLINKSFATQTHQSNPVPAGIVLSQDRSFIWYWDLSTSSSSSLFPDSTVHYPLQSQVLYCHGIGVLYCMLSGTYQQVICHLFFQTHQSQVWCCHQTEFCLLSVAIINELSFIELSHSSL
jgi:hypothetical protein